MGRQAAPQDFGDHDICDGDHDGHLSPLRYRRRMPQLAIVAPGRGEQTQTISGPTVKMLVPEEQQEAPAVPAPKAAAVPAVAPAPAPEACGAAGPRAAEMAAAGGAQDRVSGSKEKEAAAGAPAAQGAAARTSEGRGAKPMSVSTARVMPSALDPASPRSPGKFSAWK